MEQQKRKLALADAIIQAMLVKGLITRAERDKIQNHCHEVLNGANCKFFMLCLGMRSPNQVLADYLAVM